MIPSLGEVIGSLYGAWRLARADDSGMGYFDTSLTGFWHSFFAAVLVAPLFALLLALRYATGLIEASPLQYVLVEGLTYVIAWFAFPVVMLQVAPLIDRQRHYVRYIVAYNWAAVLQNAAYLPVSILGTAGLIPVDGAAFLSLLVLAAILLYTWFVTRTALSLPMGTAVALVVLDFVLGIFINVMSDAMLGGGQ